MSRASGVFSDVATEKKEYAAIWAWPILTLAFLVFGAAKLFLGFIGWLRRTPR